MTRSPSALLTASVFSKPGTGFKHRTSLGLPGLPGLLGLTLLGLSQLGCGGADDGGFTADPDAAMRGADVPEDFGPLPTFDVQPLDRGQPQVDTGVTPPPPDVVSRTDTGTTVMDTGGGTDSSTPMGGVCPASCASNADCDSCWRTGEMRVGEYCCSMGLCIYSSMTCGSVMPPPTGGDGGIEGGGGLDAGGGGDASGGFDIPEIGLDLSGGGG